MNIQKTERLVSIDALRGFDMFWIVGGDLLLRSITYIYDSPFTRGVAVQMEHVAYEGFHFYDLIFPLFLFIIGISISLSLPKIIEKENTSMAVKRIVLRVVLLFLLGIFYMGGIENGMESIYLAGVLQRISVAYLFAAIIFCFIPNRGIVMLIASLLLGYFAILYFIPVPGFGEPSFEQGKNLAHYIDHWLPGKKFEGTILSTLGAVANTLIGVIVGTFLKNHNFSKQSKVKLLVLSGIICLIIGYLWATKCPIVKAIWTSTYVMVSCGYGMVLLAIFYQIIEIWKFQKWAQPFIWIGMNSITIYIASSLFNFRKLSLRIVGSEEAHFFGNYHQFVVSVITLIFVIWLAKFLYERKIFLKI